MPGVGYIRFGLPRRRHDRLRVIMQRGLIDRDIVYDVWCENTV